MSLLSVLATIFGTLMSVGNFFQAYRIFRRKSAKDISIITYSLFFIGTIIWTLYGLEINNLAIIISNMVGVIAITLVLIGWSRYK